MNHSNIDHLIPAVILFKNVEYKHIAITSSNSLKPGLQPYLSWMLTKLLKRFAKCSLRILVDTRYSNRVHIKNKRIQVQRYDCHTCKVPHCEYG